MNDIVTAMLNKPQLPDGSGFNGSPKSLAMNATITAYKLTPEVECCQAYLKWNLFNITTELGSKYIPNIGCSGRPVIQIGDTDIKGFNNLFHYLHEKGLCAI